MIKKISLMLLLILSFSIITNAEELTKEVVEKEAPLAEIHDCSSECHYKCTNKELVPVSCENNTCKCGPEEN